MNPNDQPNQSGVAPVVDPMAPVVPADMPVAPVSPVVPQDMSGNVAPSMPVMDTPVVEVPQPVVPAATEPTMPEQTPAAPMGVPSGVTPIDGTQGGTQ